MVVRFPGTQASEDRLGRTDNCHFLRPNISAFVLVVNRRTRGHGLQKHLQCISQQPLLTAWYLLKVIVVTHKMSLSHLNQRRTSVNEVASTG